MTVWKSIPSFDGYEASNEGEIRNATTGRVLKPVLLGPKRKQYHGVYVGGGRYARKVMVHRLVAFAFHGIPDEGLIACHNDDKQFNNRADNIRWDTYTANYADSVKAGPRKMPRGSSNRNSKLSEDDVSEIKRRYSGKHGEQSALAREFGVTPGNIHCIIRGQTWIHVGGAI